jgi:nucleoside-triphosphatase THEP1
MAPTKLILWTGEKHSGKTTSVFKLAESVSNEGFTVAGLLAPSIYEDGRLAGFDAFDLQSGKRAPLARYGSCHCEACEAGRGNLKRPVKRDCFASPTMTRTSQFIGGLILGHASLSPAATKFADLIIVDEFGPLELDQRGWRKDIDSLLASSNAIILLIVRQELVELVKQLYKDVPCTELSAGEPDSVEWIIAMLKARRKKGIETLIR